jgi:catechol 2,3-dioxygenase-like lactoylglutathione lyase family enzyme
MATDGLCFNGEVTLSVAVRDRKAAAAWYAQHLGFELLYDRADISWCEMSTPVPGMHVGFADREEPRVGGPVPVLGVEDLARARAELEAAGVRFDGPNIEHDGLVKLATFYDPDGHAWMLYEAPAEAAR